MHITFLGASREVTGSHILVESGNYKILLDCGVWQGSHHAQERNYQNFAFDPKSLDAIVICHAHLDHVGRLPKIVKDGFNGPIYATAPTADLTEIVLFDNEKLMREEARRNRHATLYDIDHVKKTISMFKHLNYSEKTEILSDIFLTLNNAGHILGSATAYLELEGKKLLYSSDLGNSPSRLLDDPTIIYEADYVICESTYGGRVHEDQSNRQTKIAQIIDWTISQNAVLLIPSFAIERTQELLHDIDHFCTVNGCEKPYFYLDSPLALKATGIFEKHTKYLKSSLVSEHGDYDFFGLDRLKITESVDDSKEIRNRPNPKVIIAGSGMMTGGRILFHARDFLTNERNSLLIVGYQAQGTLGRRLFDGEKDVKIFGEPVHIKAKTWAIGSYSAHADSIQITSWLKNIRDIKKIFLVHGEHKQSLALSSKLTKELNVECFIPQQGESQEL